MKTRVWLRWVLVGLLVGAVSTSARNAPELNRVLSRLQSMGHGSYTQAEWQEAMRELDTVTAEAVRGGNRDLAVQALAVKAMALADMQRDVAGALRVLDEAKRQYAQEKLPSVRRLFIQEADYYGRLGDAVAVRRTIEEFRANPNFDPVEYPVELYDGRNTPMMVVRPSAGGQDSTAVTAMEVARERARFAPGGFFPDFTWTDGAGQPGSLQALRGKVVLVDFWHQGWTPWVRDLGNQRRAYDLYRKLGFEIVGVALDRDIAAARSYAGRERLPWPLVYGEKDLTRQLGLFGESANFLVDQNGIIIGRNLRGAELTHALQRALGAR
ncbi:MAG TPA: redoxin domain-containing protein [Kiritimatiellia bacterium]|nr:redoxin domain-containing protein [Kiritimatiellia bacterium]